MPDSQASQATPSNKASSDNPAPPTAILSGTEPEELPRQYEDAVTLSNSLTGATPCVGLHTAEGPLEEEEGMCGDRGVETSNVNAASEVQPAPAIPPAAGLLWLPPNLGAAFYIIAGASVGITVGLVRAARQALA